MRGLWGTALASLTCKLESSFYRPCSLQLPSPKAYGASEAISKREDKSQRQRQKVTTISLFLASTRFLSLLSPAHQHTNIMHFPISPYTSSHPVPVLQNPGWSRFLEVSNPFPSGKAPRMLPPRCVGDELYLSALHPAKLIFNGGSSPRPSLPSCLCLLQPSLLSFFDPPVFPSWHFPGFTVTLCLCCLVFITSPLESNRQESRGSLMSRGSSMFSAVALARSLKGWLCARVRGGMHPPAAPPRIGRTRCHRIRDGL